MYPGGIRNYQFYRKYIRNGFTGALVARGPASGHQVAMLLVDVLVVLGRHEEDRRAELAVRLASIRAAVGLALFLRKKLRTKPLISSIFILHCQIV
jgi:hypothetical protein